MEVYSECIGFTQMTLEELEEYCKELSQGVRRSAIMTQKPLSEPPRRLSSICDGVHPIVNTPYVRDIDFETAELLMCSSYFSKHDMGGGLTMNMAKVRPSGVPFDFHFAPYSKLEDTISKVVDNTYGAKYPKSP